MDNIYITKVGTFSFYANSFVSMSDDIFSYDLIENWLENIDLMDFTAEVNGKRYRVNLFQTTTGFNAALRLLPDKLENLEGLGINSSEVDNIIGDSGLTLFCGATGAGKSTTMNSVINRLLLQDKLGITITVEDPIEYLHDEPTIFQREVRRHTPSFEQGLIESMRQTPRTIAIGEIRDSATALEAVRAGLNGHRVLATFHSSSVVDGISRLWALLDDQMKYIAVQSLQGLMSQTLVPDNQGNLNCIYEVIKIDDQARNMLFQILDPKSPAGISSLNHLFYDQKQNTIFDKKQALGLG